MNTPDEAQEEEREDRYADYDPEKLAHIDGFV